MTTTNPPRLAVALLRRFVSDNEPLAGDLLEGYAVRRSRLWFWRQVLLAVAIRAFQPRDASRPLGLANGPVSWEDRERTLPARRVNLTASPLPGIGGLGLVALGVIVALVRPDAWWMFLPAILGGIALGVVMVLVRRNRPHTVTGVGPHVTRTRSDGG